jgi:hypothetical protein
MSKKLLLSLTIMAGVLFVGASPALATNLNCQNSASKRAQYTTGVTLGKSIVVQAWHSTDEDPNSFEEFYATIRPIILGRIADLPSGASDLVKCRAKGLSQGVCDGFGIIQDEVGAVCLLDGQTWGNLSGDLYCALSIEFGGVEALGLVPVPPTNLCGTNFVAGCIEEFVSYAEADANACDAFTEAPHENVYADWQSGMCAYELP